MGKVKVVGKGKNCPVVKTKTWRQRIRVNVIDFSRYKTALMKLFQRFYCDPFGKDKNSNERDFVPSDLLH